MEEKKNVKQEEQELDYSKFKKVELVGMLLDAEKSLSNAKKALIAVKAELDELRDEVSNLSDVNRNQLATISSLEARCKKVADERDNFKVIADKTDKIVGACRKREDALKLELDGVTNKLAMYKEKAAMYKEDYNICLDRLNQEQDKSKVLDAQVVSLKKEIQRIRDYANDLEKKFIALVNRNWWQRLWNKDVNK